jgi:hypothetical protein
MDIRVASGHRAPWLMAACLLSSAVCGGVPVQAGPTLETRENMAIGAQATFNNNWAQTFEAKGSMNVEGSTVESPILLAPFAFVGVENTPVIIPNAGLAQLTATVTEMTVNGGQLEAAASVNPLFLLSLDGTQDIEDPDIMAPSSTSASTTSQTGNNIVLNSSVYDGLPALRITPGTTDSSVIGASIIGTNIGSDSLQVTGSISTTVINTLGLSAF